MMTVIANESITGWVVGYTIAIAVVLVVVALVVPILLLAHKIGQQALDIDAPLVDAVSNTSALVELNTTIDSAAAVVAGLERGRNRLGG